MENDGITFKVTLEEELVAVEYELNQINSQLSQLTARKNELLDKKHQIRDKMLLEKSNSLSKKDWAKQKFPWSEKLEGILKSRFNLKCFRPQQLSTINASMSGQDALLIMPTGGGKSLCYQLPALTTSGLTLVISPLISLMEDQVMSLRKLNIDAKLLNSATERSETTAILKQMIQKDSDLHLLYVTPERLAKSKRFMANLQKCFAAKKLDRIAIDEVHCCSQWGHDFRPDYKFLGILRSMFPGVPLMGLTATATSRVIVDVQKMLDIEGCLVMKASFNRPNLYYHVLNKPSVQAECIQMLTTLLKKRYADQSGIIYTTTIKDAEDLTTELRSKGLKVGCYHANMDPAYRSKMHSKWMEGQIQAVVATIAFGLGIDKPDVRFVIHHALSKSMESFYQESGRSGRDGKRSECIVLYRLADIFKLSPMVFSNQTGLPNLYGMVEYCLDSQRCRRRIIASHFDEGWDSTQCSEMCDFCLRINKNSSTKNIVQYCRDCYKILQQSAGLDTQLTAQKLIDAWLHKGPVNLRVSSLKPPSITREQAEDIIALLIIKGYLREDFHFTAYSTISYLKRGPQAASALRDGSEINVVLPYRIKFNLDEKAPTSIKKITAQKDFNNSDLKKEKSIEVKASSSKNDSNCQRKKSSVKNVAKEESSNKRKLSKVICLSSDEGSDVERKVKKKKIKIIDSSDSETDDKKKKNLCN